jgi:hypothetical protein
LRRLVLCALAALSGGCERAFVLANAAGSPVELASAVVDALGAKDEGALRRVALTEEEFRRLVWPKLPASRPERNVPLDYAWSDLSTKSDLNLRARLAAWEDRGFRVVSIDFTGATTDYGAFVVRRDSLIRLRDRSGVETTGRLFGSVIEQHGRYKVFSYVVD